MSDEILNVVDPPLFTIELGSNGGTLSPSTGDDLIKWLQTELSSWAWLNNRSYGIHESGFRELVNAISQTINQTNEYKNYLHSNPTHAKNLLNNVESIIRSFYVDRNFPHSSTPIFFKIESIRKQYGEMAASFYAAARLDTTGIQLQPIELASWKGLIEAINDLYGPIGEGKSKVKALEKSIDLLREKLESTLGNSQNTFDELHRNYNQIRKDIGAQYTEAEANFIEAQTTRNDEFENLKASHMSSLEDIRKTFREEFALSAPAEYWTSKRNAHRIIAGITGAIAFIAIPLCAYFLAREIQSLLSSTLPNATPDHWKIAVLALVSIFAVWAVRLIVRIFLSHMHLAGDSSERVVMLKTYLSLIEGGQLTKDGERQLILHALFRPASDGIVKDEGVPPSFIDILTRNPKNP